MLELCFYCNTPQASSSALRCPVLMNMAQLPEIKPRNSFLKMFFKCCFVGSDYSQNIMREQMMEKVPKKVANRGMDRQLHSTASTAQQFPHLQGDLHYWITVHF